VSLRHCSNSIISSAWPLEQVDERLSELSSTVDSRLQANETKLVAVADDSSATIERLAAQLAVEAEALRAESNWGLTLQAETVADEITRNAETLRADLAENATQFQNRVTDTLQAVSVALSSSS
jgi:hypothetical protein